MIFIQVYLLEACQWCMPFSFRIFLNHLFIYPGPLFIYTIAKPEATTNAFW